MKNLIDGKIPENTVCPFSQRCGFKDKDCPTTLETRKKDKFTCVVARYFDAKFPYLVEA